MTQCKWAVSLGELEGTHQKAWGTTEYKSRSEPTVFFGLYDLRDYIALWRHQGKAYVLWAGSDIRNLLRGFVLNDGKLKLISGIGGNAWVYSILKKAEHWVENEAERDALRAVGIEAKICPSFLGDIDEFPVSFKPGNKIYTSVSGDNFEQYGWDKINELAKANPMIEFHFYGNNKEWVPDWNNMIVHGRVPKEQMNKEIKEMQGGLRMTEFDGASEIIVKAMLMGQYCFSLIDYPYVHNPKDLHLLTSLKTANIEGRDWWRKNLNNYPWNINYQKKQEER